MLKMAANSSEQNNAPQPSLGTPAQRAVQKKLEHDQHISTKANTSKWILKNLCQVPESQLTPSTNGQTEEIPNGIDEYSKLVIKKATAAYHAFSNQAQGGVGGALTGIAGSINNLETKFVEGAEDFAQMITPQLAEALRPIPVGGIVNTATAIVKDPLGSLQLLPNKIMALVDKVSPDFANQIDSAAKSINLDGLTHLPSKMMGSLRNLATGLDELLSVPFELLSDMYNGLMAIMEAIADLIDGIMTAIMNLIQKIIFQILDSILPISEIMSFLEAINEISSMIGDIASLTGGFSMVTDITSQVSNFSSQFSSALQNPLQTALSYAPGIQQGIGQVTGAVSQVTGALRNPEQVLGQFLPPGIKDQMQNISKIPGLGFVGNLGYSVGDTLDTLSDGFFAKALDQASSQLPILGPLFNKQSDSISTLTEPTASGSTAFTPAAENPTMQVGTANTVQLEDTSNYQIFSEKTRQDAAETVRQGPFKAAFDRSNPNLWDSKILPDVPTFPTPVKNKTGNNLAPTNSWAQELNAENARRKDKGLPPINYAGEVPRQTNRTGLADV